MRLRTEGVCIVIIKAFERCVENTNTAYVTLLGCSPASERCMFKACQGEKCHGEKYGMNEFEGVRQTRIFFAYTRTYG